MAHQHKIMDLPSVLQMSVRPPGFSLYNGHHARMHLVLSGMPAGLTVSEFIASGSTHLFCVFGSRNIMISSARVINLGL